MKTHAFALLALAISLPEPMFAQERWPLSVEANVGVTRGQSDASARYRGSSNGGLADILIGVRLHPPGRAGAFIALDAAVHAINWTTTSDCLPLSDGSCAPWFPGFGAVTLLGGWESQSTRLRVLGGPGIVSSDNRATPGFVGRLDVAMPVLGHISLTANANTLIVPSWNGDRFYFLAGGLGLRIR